MSTSPAVVVVYKPDHIGDVVLTTPLFRLLRMSFGSECRIIAVVGPWSSVILANNPYVDTIVPFTSAYMKRGGQLNEEERLANARTLFRIQELSPDWVINVRDDYGHVVHAYAMSSGRANLVSHVTHHSWRHLVSAPVDYDGRVHEAVRHVQLLRPLGIHARQVDIVPEVFPSAEDRAEAQDLLASVDPGRSICLFAGGGHPLNYWPLSQFLALAQRLARAGWCPVFVGGPQEAQALEPHRGDLASLGALDLTGRTTLLQLSAVFGAVRRLVSNDGGPMHVAAASGADVVALFGSSPKTFYPFGSQHVVIDHEWWCRPCPHFTWEKRIQCGDNLCMQSITIDEVWNAIDRKWLAANS